MKEWGTWVRQVRIQRNLKQAAFAEMIGVDQATVSRWEAGRTRPDAQAQNRIRTLMGSRPADSLIRHWVKMAIGGVVLVNSNRIILAASAQYSATHQIPVDEIVGLSVGPVFTEESDRLWQTAHNQGLFWGQIASVSAVTLTNSLSGHFHNVCTKCIWMPAPLADGEIVVRCEGTYLDGKEYSRALMENGGPIRITKIADLAA